MGDVISFSDRRALGVATDDHDAEADTSRTQPVATSAMDAPYFSEKRFETDVSQRDANYARQQAVPRHSTRLSRSRRIDGSHDTPFSAEQVVRLLEAAGRTLLALPGTGYSTGLRVSRLEIVQSALAAFGTECGPVRAAVPSAAAISQMDEALGWIALIPVETVARGRPGGGNVLRRIVGARALVGPITERHIYSWRRLGSVLGADHKAVQRWHAQAIDLIVGALNRPHA